MKRPLEANTGTSISDPESRVLVEFVSPDGSIFGAPIEIPLSTGSENLQELLVSIEQEFGSKNAEEGSVADCPHSFSLLTEDGSAEVSDVTTSIADALHGIKFSGEKVLRIRYHPLAQFRIRPVTRCSASMEGHTGPVLCAAFSRDSQMLATGSGDSTVRLWDIQTGMPSNILTGAHKSWILAVAWSSDNKYLLSACKDGTVQVWSQFDLDGRSSSISLKGHLKPVTCAVWEPYGHRVATGGIDGQVKIWDGRTGRIIMSLSSHTAPVMQVKWSGVTGRLYSAGRDRVIKVWDPETGRHLNDLKGHGHWINTLSLFSDAVTRNCETKEAYLSAVRAAGGERLLTGSDDMTMILWREDKQVARLTGHQKVVNCAQFSPDGKYIASASFDKSVRVWLASTGQFVCALRGHVGDVYLLSWSIDSRMIVSCSKDSTLKVWDVKEKKLKEDLPGHADEIFAVDWSADGSSVASGGRDRIVKIWRH
jgi:ribosome assembly protein 4